jgi:molybdopterin molybdotransferase
MLSVDEARARILDGVVRLGAETTDLDNAAGRTLAAPIRAARDQPPFDASVMDGYALRAADTPGDLRIVGESAAGAAFSRPLGRGEAVRISTGARLPGGADAVLAQEDARIHSDILTVSKLEPRHYVRPRGGDFRADQLLLTEGRLIDPGAMALLAGSGARRPSVTRRPLVSILCNGSELVPPGAGIGADQIYDSASFAVASLARAWGADVRRSDSIPDDERAIAAAAQRELGACDVLVFIGGASVGPHDHARPVMQCLGVDFLFHGIAVRPGRPTWFGKTEYTLVLGLPGNPASALVCARLFLAPLIESMLVGRPTYSCTFEAGPLAAPMSANGGREAYVRATRQPGAQTIAPFADEDSSLMSVLASANALIRRAIGAAPAPSGELVQYLRWTP